jgi:glycosyltransferase involved in cell wall biosynthesis
MHVCIITHEYPKPGFAHGGIGSFIKTLAPKLVQKGVKVTIIGLNYENVYDYEEDNGVVIYRLNYQNIKHLGWYFGAKAISKKIAEVHAQHPIDIVEASELGLFCIDKIKKVKYIIRLHGGHHFFADSENRKINFWKGFQEKRSFGKADAFIPVSNYVRTHTNQFLSYHNKPVSLINYPIDVDFFAPKAVPLKKYSIVFMGSVCEKKGVRQLIQAFPLVKDKFPEATLEIYGREWFFPDGSSYTEMLKKDILPSLGELTKDVFFHGIVNYQSVPDKYATAHVCVFPSHMETQGLVAPEAMAMQKMVVFTNKGPGPETIVEYQTGLLCDPYQLEDIAQKINWVFENDEKVIEIEQNARAFVLKKFSAEIIVQKNIDFFISLIKN